ncbi:MAG: MarR family transcriptional regulator [Spirochaetota bacterium]|nr:MarR family transcriptional regulator [Spirochaetota bacterium]
MNYRNENNIHLLDEQTQRLRYLIREMHDCCQDRMLYESNKFNLPQSELRCLMLFKGEKNLTAKEIAHKMDVAKSRVTKIITSLLKKGLVERIDDPKDGRIKLISITTKGEKKIGEMESFIIEIHEKLMLQLEPDVRERILENLEILRVAMEFVKGTFA